MKKFIITVSLVFGFIFSYGQPSVKEIDKIVLNTWTPEIGLTQSYRIYETNTLVKLKLDSISYYPNGFINEIFFTTIEDNKRGWFIFKKTIVEKNSIFILNGGDATVMVRKTYLPYYYTKINLEVEPYIIIKNNIVEYKIKRV